MKLSSPHTNFTDSDSTMFFLTNVLLSYRSSITAGKMELNLYVYIYIYIYVYLSIYLYTYLYTYLSIYLPTYLPIYLSINQSIYQYINISIYISGERRSLVGRLCGISRWSLVSREYNFEKICGAKQESISLFFPEGCSNSYLYIYIYISLFSLSLCMYVCVCMYIYIYIYKT